MGAAAGLLAGGEGVLQLTVFHTGCVRGSVDANVHYAPAVRRPRATWERIPICATDAVPAGRPSQRHERARPSPFRAF
jgi:hypothetical protein